MSQNKIVKGLAIVGGATLAYHAGMAIADSAMNKVEYEMLGYRFDFNQVSRGRVGVEVDLAIDNGNPVGLIVYNIIGKVRYGDLHLTDLDLPAPLRVPPNARATTTVRFSVQAMTLINDILAAFQQAGNTYNTLVNRLYFEGVVYTNLINIPLEMEIPIAVG